MNEFYKHLIKQTEEQKAKDSARLKDRNALLQIKDERAIPKLRVRRKWSKKPRRKRP